MDKSLLLCIPLALPFAILLVLLWPIIKTIPAAWRRIDEHEELFAWLLDEFGKNSPELQAANGVMIGFEEMTDRDAETLRGLIAKAPRRVANDLRMFLHDYDQWKAAK